MANSAPNRCASHLNGPRFQDEDNDAKWLFFLANTIKRATIIFILAIGIVITHTSCVPKSLLSASSLFVCVCVRLMAKTCLTH